MSRKLQLMVLSLIAALSFGIGGFVFSTKATSDTSAAEQIHAAQRRHSRPEPKSYFGVQGQMAFQVTDVDPSSPAEGLGIRPGDFITEVDGQQLDSIDDLLVIAQREPGAQVGIQFFRRDSATGRNEVYEGLAALQPPKQ
jgi:S1-C subfamily serine protease